MSSTILATFETIDTARTAINALNEAGFPREDIGFAIRDTEGFDGPNENSGNPVVNDAIAGALVGSVVGVSAIFLPGVGLIATGGPLAGLLTALTGAGVGAASGAVIGGTLNLLMDAGLSEEEARQFVESLRGGAALVTVSAYEHDADRARTILEDHDPIDLDQRVIQWQKSASNRFDPLTEPFSAEERATNNDTR